MYNLNTKAHFDYEKKAQGGLTSFKLDFQMFLTIDGVYSSDIKAKENFRDLEKQLNAKITLKEMCCNKLLGMYKVHDQDLIEKIPKESYETFLKCAIYSLNKDAIKVCIYFLIFF